MGRRALGQVDPSLDLSRHLKSFEDLPRPWNHVAIFGRQAPLEIEVGSGKGMFLLSTAPQRPDTDFLGIEIAFRYARFTAARLASRGITNACVARADAGRVLREIVPAESVAAVHVYFPDPWWKTRHKKRRVLNEVFVARIEQVLQPGGMLHFWTDVEEYYRSTLALIKSRTQLTGPFEVPEELPAHDFDYRTHFERRMRLAAQAVYRAEFRKVS
jgi:tRNA (guanine-N7-)-methyltransferase